MRGCSYPLLCCLDALKLRQIANGNCVSDPKDSQRPRKAILGKLHQEIVEIAEFHGFTRAVDLQGAVWAKGLNGHLSLSRFHGPSASLRYKPVITHHPKNHEKSTPRIAVGGSAPLDCKIVFGSVFGYMPADNKSKGSCFISENNRLSCSSHLIKMNVRNFAK